MMCDARSHRDRDCNMADLGKVVNTFLRKNEKKIKNLCYLDNRIKIAPIVRHGAWSVGMGGHSSGHSQAN